MELATFSIKPDWMGVSSRGQILDRVGAIAGTKILKTKEIVLTAPILEALYDRHAKTSGHQLYWQAIQNDLLDKTVTAGILGGQHVFWNIVAVTGVSTNPTKCALGTIRREFGKRVKPVPCGDLRYWKNVIHRSTRPMEAQRDLNLFFPGFVP